VFSMKLGPPMLRKYTGILEEGVVVLSDILSDGERLACAPISMVVAVG
jgi:hypothetical protein